MKKLLLFLLLGLTLLTMGCTSTATKLNSIKANYNAGNYDIVLGETKGKKIYSAQDVIDEATEGKDTLTASQAELIKARAQISSLLNDDDLDNSLCKSTGIQEAINAIKRIRAHKLPYEWMKIEVAASVADSYQICNDKVGAFFSYDYVISQYDFSKIDQTLMGYTLHWATAYKQIQGNSFLNKKIRTAAKNKYESTLKFLTKTHPNQPIVLYSEAIRHFTDGSIVEATLKIINARLLIPKNTADGRDLLKLLDKQMNDEMKKNTMPGELKTSYTTFINTWETLPPKQ
ncbi:MAG: hypothetical protein OCC46_00005 [Pseudodesulfovibrio sp.]